ncbi:hypothetical protein N3K66_001557 [Trichothecium roseum]|uniref:Uncharacterized protein n=1 Tax=Trichothecium roseum TaxID=47278 RepID=A0ACC0VGY9_9HYPO|nr:hypothetical protein N3K66_001557 [Trichothecium roseum]
MASLGSGGCITPNLRPLLTPRCCANILPELRSQRQWQRGFLTTALQSRASAPPSPLSKKTFRHYPAPPSSRHAPGKSHNARAAAPGTPAATAAGGAAAAAAASPSNYAFIKALATKPMPTVLYEGPRHRWFHFGCWSSGISILAWTALTGPTVIFQPAEIPTWVSWTYGAAYTVLGAMGFALLSKTPRIVSMIRVLPTYYAGPGKAATAPAPGGSLRVELTVQRMFPWFSRPRVLTAPAEAVSLTSRFSLPQTAVPELRRWKDEVERLEAERERRRFDMAHLMTVPFRRVGRAFVAMFEGVRAAFTGMGFGGVKVGGKEYKVDVTSGFAHDGFRTLEKVVGIEEK